MILCVLWPFRDKQAVELVAEVHGQAVAEGVA